VRDRDRPREIGQEEDACLQCGDKKRFATFVVTGDRSPELADTCADLSRGEVELPDAIRVYDARSSLYRSARRWMSRL
jgi:hypothetical protein